MSDKPESKYFWADIGPDFDPVYSGNPNENCFTLCVLAADYDALVRDLAEARGLLERVSSNIQWDALPEQPTGDSVDTLCRDLRAFLAEKEGER